MAVFQTSLKVRSYECDMYGHVNNATFLNYLEYGRVELLNELGYTLDSLKADGFLLPIIKIEIEYKQQVLMGDHLTITVEWERRGRSSATFRQNIFKDSSKSPVASAIASWVATDLTGTPIQIPQEFIQRYERTFGPVSLVTKKIRSLD
ncbi:MAG: acyl-CoA thioesterase [Calditrichaceae bacterium]